MLCFGYHVARRDWCSSDPKGLGRFVHCASRRASIVIAAMTMHVWTRIVGSERFTPNRSENWRFLCSAKICPRSCVAVASPRWTWSRAVGRKEMNPRAIIVKRSFTVGLKIIVRMNKFYVPLRRVAHAVPVRVVNFSEIDFVGIECVVRKMRADFATASSSFTLQQDLSGQQLIRFSPTQFSPQPSVRSFVSVKSEIFKTSTFDRAHYNRRSYNHLHIV